MLLSARMVFSQATVQPKIMVIPFTKDGEDIRTVLDNDVLRRVAIAKVNEGLAAKGFQTVDFVGKLKAARDNQVFTSDNQTDIKAKIIEMSGSDIYIVAEVTSQQDNSGSGVSVILNSYETATGNSIASKVGNSGKFYTDDLSRLTAKAVEKCIEGFTEMVTARLADMERNGQSVLVSITFGENAASNMSSVIEKENLPLSDVLENWISKKAVNGNYHLQGTTQLKMIFDEVRIPVRDANNNRFSSNKFALEIFSYLRTLGLQPAKDVKGNTIYITIN